MLITTIFLFALGFTAAILLAFASKIFYVWEDPMIEKIEDALLGANCGGCGYAGCSAAAEAVVRKEAGADICVAGGFEIAQQVAAVLGLTVEEKEPEFSESSCRYGVDIADLKYTYNGVIDCRAAMLLYGGSKECFIGCLGLSTCVRACPFGALSMGENNLPVVNKDKCTGCGICVEVCPKDIITLTSATKRIMSDYKVSECTAPCQRNCPTGIDIPQYIRHISNNNYSEAVRVIKEKNPFPFICGWICPAPCEFECRRNLVDEPVAINSLKKFVAEYEMKSGKRDLPFISPTPGKNIAVIGGGIEGLTASYYLRRLGHTPKIYEASEKLGGILRHVITEDRLPRNIIDWEVSGILETGVEAETGKVMGKDFSFSSLLNNGSDMVLLTTGGWDSRQILRPTVKHENIIPATYLLLEFLIASANIKTGKKVVIAGGGKAAVKAANICLDKGAEEVTIVYPFSRKEAQLKNIELVESDKIKYIFSAAPCELLGKEESLKKILVRNINDKIEEIALDTLLVGSGRFPEMLFEKTEEGGWKTVEIFKAIAAETNMGIFSVSETGRTSDLTGVVIAVGHGRRMAKAIQLYTSEEELSPEVGIITDEEELQNIYKIENAEDLKAPKGVIDPRDNLSEEEAGKEAARCLDCGLICYKKKLNVSEALEVSV